MDKRILIVDDAMFMRKIIRKILNEGGYQDVSEALLHMVRNAMDLSLIHI